MNRRIIEHKLTSNYIKPPSKIPIPTTSAKPTSKVHSGLKGRPETYFDRKTDQG